MRRVLAPLLAAVAVAGCASRRSPLQVHAEEVVQIQRDRVGRCRPLGAVQGRHANGASVAENEHYATEDVRGKVARIGGNAYTVEGRDDRMWGSTVRAEAYLCPSWEPVPGLPPEDRERR